MLQLACRHHILELIIAAVARTIMGKTTAPTDPLFESFRKMWAGLDLSNFSKIEENQLTPWLFELQKNTATFLQNVIYFTRGDYRELAELTLLVLEEQPRRGSHFNRPGAYHHARWMAKVLYYTKIMMFQ